MKEKENLEDKFFSPIIWQTVFALFSFFFSALKTQNQ